MEGRDQDRKIKKGITPLLHCSLWGQPALVALSCSPKWKSSELMGGREQEPVAFSLTWNFPLVDPQASHPFSVPFQVLV